MEQKQDGVGLDRGRNPVSLLLLLHGALSRSSIPRFYSPHYSAPYTMVILVTSDNEQFTVDRKVIELSDVIRIRETPTG